MASKRAEVDTTRPFRSVKEAVSVFGERILAGDAFTLKGNINSARHEPAPEKAPMPIISSAVSSPRRSFSSPSSHFNHEEETLLISLKKLETELEETKKELKVLKKKEAETEVAVASLNAELHQNMSKIAEMEAISAGNAAKISSSRTIESVYWEQHEDEDEDEEEEEEKEREIEELVVPSKYEYLPTLAQVLSLGEIEEELCGKKKKKMNKVVKNKKKPIIPLISDIFSIKRNSQNNSFYL